LKLERRTAGYVSPLLCALARTNLAEHGSLDHRFLEQGASWGMIGLHLDKIGQRNGNADLSVEIWFGYLTSSTSATMV
jgi:hypothetical protein